MLRTVLWAGAAAFIGALLCQLSDWSLRNVIRLVAAATLLAFSVGTVRSLWYQRVCLRFRLVLFARVAPLKRFADSFASELAFASMVVCSATASAAVALVYFALPISREQFVSLFTALPLGVAAVLGVIALSVGASTKKLARFLEPAVDGATSPRPGPTTIYRLSQVLPYRAAALHLLCWVIVSFFLSWLARGEFRLEFDDSIFAVRRP